MANRNDDGTFRGKQAKKLTQRTLGARWVEAEAIRLKRLGMDFSRIADQITAIGRGRAKPITDFPAGLQFADNYKISAQGCHQAYQRAIRREPALAVEEYRRIDSDRCEEMLLALQPGIRRGDPRSVEAGVKLLGHRAKLMGLESPKRVEMTGKDGSPIEISEPPLTKDERRARAIEIAKLLKEVGALNDE
jgi:hypothetical protein